MEAYTKNLVTRTTNETKKVTKSFSYPYYIEAIELLEDFPPKFSLYNGIGSLMENLGQFTAQYDKTILDPNKMLK